MDSVGAILKAAREEKNLSFDQVSSGTHILSSYIQALEENRFQDLPGEAYCTGFIRMLARYYGLDSSKLAAQFRGIPEEEKSEPDSKPKKLVNHTKMVERRMMVPASLFF